MYSALGCPYLCTFCSSPAEYRDIPGKKWIPLEVQEVVDHVEYVVTKYRANFVYFIDIYNLFSGFIFKVLRINNLLLLLAFLLI